MFPADLPASGISGPLRAAPPETARTDGLEAFLYALLASLGALETEQGPAGEPDSDVHADAGPDSGQAGFQEISREQSKDAPGPRPEQPSSNEQQPATERESIAGRSATGSDDAAPVALVATPASDVRAVVPGPAPEASEDAARTAESSAAGLAEARRAVRHGAPKQPLPVASQKAAETASGDAQRPPVENSEAESLPSERQDRTARSESAAPDNAPDDAPDDAPGEIAERDAIPRPGPLADPRKPLQSRPESRSPLEAAEPTSNVPAGAQDPGRLDARPQDLAVRNQQKTRDEAIPTVDASAGPRLAPPSAPEGPPTDSDPATAPADATDRQTSAAAPRPGPAVDRLAERLPAEGALRAGEIRLPAVHEPADADREASGTRPTPPAPSTGFPQAVEPEQAKDLPALFAPVADPAIAAAARAIRAASPRKPGVQPLPQEPVPSQRLESPGEAGHAPGAPEPQAAFHGFSAVSHPVDDRPEAPPAPIARPAEAVRLEAVPPATADPDPLRPQTEPARLSEASEPALARAPAQPQPQPQPAGAVSASSSEVQAPSPARPAAEPPAPPSPGRPSSGVFDRLEAAMEQPTPDGARLRVVVHDDRLGRVSVRLVERAGLIDAMLRADRPDAARTLADSLGALSESLARRGLESRETDFSQAGHGGSPHDPRDSGGRRGRGRDASSGRQNRRRAAAAFAAALSSQGD